jgi:streptomycin 6-kinase
VADDTVDDGTVDDGTVSGGTVDDGTAGDDAAGDDIVVPAAFRAMPRWWREGTGWLDGLPAAVRTGCARWRLGVDGEPAHGSNALVVPVVRGDERLVLRLTPPGPDVAAQVAALRFWAGRGTVLLRDADEAVGTMVLERLDGEHPLSAAPVGEAMAVLGGIMRRLAVPAPAHAPSTGAAAAAEAAELARAAAARPGSGAPAAVDPAFVRAALAVAPALATPATQLAVDGDLHSGQVLRGIREPWLVVDPVLMRGDIEYHLARVLWTRLDEMPDRDITGHFDTVVEAAGVDRDRARDWVVLRAAGYLRWGLAHGLTEDPPRCRRLLSVFA